MTDTVNMSLDEIIKQSRASRTRGRGGGNIRGRGGGRGGRRGRGGRGRGAARGRSQSRGAPNTRQARSRSRSRGQNNSQTRDRSQSRARSRSNQRRFSNPKTRSGSRARPQGRQSMTPKSRAGLENPNFAMTPLVWSNRGKRGGPQSRLRRSNSFHEPRGGVHSRLGINTRRASVSNNTYKPLAVAKRGISKRGRGLITRNTYRCVGLRSDQILKKQRQNIMQNNVIRSQTFTRSRNNSLNSASQLTVSIANNFNRRRRNSAGNAGYLNKQTLAELNNEFVGYNTRKGPGSVKSMGSNRSNRSMRSNQSNRSNRSNSSKRSRGRGRGRGGNRGVGRNFVNKQILNPALQKEIAAIQGKTYRAVNNTEVPSGVNFSPTPATTHQTLHQRFGSS